MILFDLLNTKKDSASEYLHDFFDIYLTNFIAFPELTNAVFLVEDFERAGECRFERRKRLFILVAKASRNRFSKRPVSNSKQVRTRHAAVGQVFVGQQSNLDWLALQFLAMPMRCCFLLGVLLILSTTGEELVTWIADLEMAQEFEVINLVVVEVV